MIIKEPMQIDFGASIDDITEQIALAIEQDESLRIINKQENQITYLLLSCSCP